MHFNFLKLSKFTPLLSKNFHLLRYFSITSFGAFLLTILFLGRFYHQRAIQNLVEISEESNSTVAQSLSNTLWDEYRPFLLSTAKELSDEELRYHPKTLNLQQAIANQIQGLSVVKVKIFDTNGRTVFSTDLSQIGDDKSESAGFLSAQSGQTISQIGHRDSFKALENTITNRHLLSSYIPINRNDNIVGVFELYSDVTPLQNRANRTERTIILGSTLILGLSFGILWLIVWQAHNTIKKQQSELQASATNFEEQSQKLGQTLNKLQQTQAQLVQNEKMSGLGQLVAGIAHEINNPVNFIHGNLKPATDSVEDLLTLITLYQQACPHPEPSIQAAIDEIDYEFIQQDFPYLMNSLKIGTTRIREIVKSLRTFSRLDESECKPADIHDGIDSTLTILGHRLKVKPNQREIKIHKDYDQLPKIDCYAGQLNQVFMNVLSNAIDALNQVMENDATFRPRIDIRTELTSNQWVSIDITNNGPAISKEIQAKIMDPFFTTKPVGEGTGMGLAISYQVIVDQHQGHFNCSSEDGQGTTFTIQIPLTQASMEASVSAQPIAA